MSDVLLETILQNLPSEYTFKEGNKLDCNFDRKRVRILLEQNLMILVGD